MLAARQISRVHHQAKQCTKRKKRVQQHADEQANHFDPLTPHLWSAAPTITMVSQSANMEAACSLLVHRVTIIPYAQNDNGHEVNVHWLNSHLRS